MKQQKQFLPSLGEDVHIWNCEVDFDADLVLRYRNILSAAEIKRANRFKFESDSIIFVTARAVLRLLSSKYLEINPEVIQFNYTEFGKPFFKIDTPLRFNVSHSGERIVIAFCNDYEVGVDIEKIKKNFDVMELAQQFFSKHEIKALERMPDKELSHAFYRCWTRKESFIKAEGSGLSFPLDKFTVSIDEDDHAHLLQIDWDELEKSNWSMFSFLPQENYIVAICIRKKNTAMRYFNWSEI